MKKRILSMALAAALTFGASQQAMAQTKQAVVVGSSGNVTTVKDGTADAEGTSGKTYVETTSGNTVTITTSAPEAGKVAKVTVRSYNVSSASDAKVRVTGLTVTGTGGATIVNKGSTLQMTATAAPTYADWKTVTWSITSGSEYASIDATTGVLTAGTEEGEVVVTATATDGSEVTGQCTVTVVKPVPAGAVRGKFTINAGGEQVYFAQGNLQATTTDLGANWTWGFATNQWDFIGNNDANNAISGNGTVSANGSVDLFGWSTAATTYGIHNSTTAGDYSGDFVDWGETIGTGWRTLTKDEWDYLFFTRASGSKVNNLATTNARYTHAIINTDNGTDGIKGMILFPDGVTINYNDVSSWGEINQYSNWDGSTKCTISQWNALAAKGFVFLPTAGSRNGTTINNSNSNGYYWSSYTASPTNNNAYYTRVVSAVEPTTQYDSRYFGFAVRLVTNVLGSISYATTSVEKGPNAAPFTNPLTNTGDGTVTYARSDGDVICTVNATTGEVTLNGTIGTCTITATVADGSIYPYATHTVSYTLTVVDFTSIPLTVEALADGAIQIKSPKVGMQYSIDGGEKQSITSTSDINIEVSEGQKVQFYGNGTSITSYGSSSATQFRGVGDDFRYKVYGNIMSLVDETDFATNPNPTLPSTATFSWLFNYNQHLTDASGLVLPAMTLTANCYKNMFAQCSRLTAAPELPATTVAERCYEYMFNKCTSLTTVPASLPATTLANAGYCYSQMFSECSSLTTAPELPAETLAQYCYNSMFYKCTSLTTAPELPAETLAQYCYNMMFRDCSSLTTVPTTLPAETLTDNCYYAMFNGCSSLTTAPNLPAENLAQYCYYQMFANCTNLTNVPATLPATTLVNDCYNNMFYGCKSLTTAPVLPAPTLVKRCYYYMFADCSNLSSITCLATNNTAEECTSFWNFYGVAASGTFYKAASMTGWTTGVSGIPSGWTVQNYVAP